jgi:hypothetical protein
MEEPYKEATQQTKEWIREAGLEQPNQVFEMKIMERIEAKRSLQKAKPLISVKGWCMLGLVFMMSIILLYIYPSETLSFKRNNLSGFLSKMGRIKAVTLSETTQYAFIFLALFLVQLPFLKQYLEKQRT